MCPLDEEGVDLRGSWRGIDICDTGGIAGVCNHLITQWIDPVPSMKRNTNSILMVIGTEANHWLQPHSGGWCWHFHPISTAYRHQRKQNFEICLHGEREGEKPRGETRESVQSPFLINRQASVSDFIQTCKKSYSDRKIYTVQSHHTHTHIHWQTIGLTGTHINISAEQKLHFLLSFTSCILNIIFQRKSLNVSSLLGTERSYLDYRLQAITKNWILSLIAVMCSASAKKPEDVNEEIKMRKMTCMATIFHVVKELELMVSI